MLICIGQVQPCNVAFEPLQPPSVVMLDVQKLVFDDQAVMVDILSMLWVKSDRGLLAQLAALMLLPMWLPYDRKEGLAQLVLDRERPSASERSFSIDQSSSSSHGSPKKWDSDALELDDPKPSDPFPQCQDQ